jgi:hypothetical protein
VLTRLPDGATTLLELDPSVPCEPLGSVEDVAARVREVEPEAELSDPSHGWIRSSTWSIELGIGREDPVEWIRLFVRGSGDDVVERIVRLADALGCVVFDDGELESVWDAQDVRLWHAYQRACEEEDSSHAG